MDNVGSRLGQEQHSSTDLEATPVKASTAAEPTSVRRFHRILSLHDFEVAAQRHLPRPIFGYIAGAAETNASLLDNRSAFQEFGFVPRVLIDVSKRTQNWPAAGLMDSKLS